MLTDTDRCTHCRRTDSLSLLRHITSENITFACDSLNYVHMTLQPESSDNGSWTIKTITEEELFRKLAFEKLYSLNYLTDVRKISGPVYSREGPCTRETDTDENIEESLRAYVKKQICLCGILKNSSDVINDVCIRLCASNLLEADVCIWYKKREIFKYFKETDMDGLEEVHWLLFGREGWITRVRHFRSKLDMGLLVNFSRQFTLAMDSQMDGWCQQTIIENGPLSGLLSS
ncbi:hypothetical protein P879_07434 [Paragonimus westermani]|uniref:Uncharacterized protein n=1 Tax=Paragonimus westermani TaxID=34504 RepID=A0A8T0D560_9TREM|nr:hypothetical protein P879_07434 [Paragonimus westermani]